jgi:hypothetical protein
MLDDVRLAHNAIPSSSGHGRQIQPLALSHTTGGGRRSNISRGSRAMRESRGDRQRLRRLCLPVLRFFRRVFAAHIGREPVVCLGTGRCLLLRLAPHPSPLATLFQFPQNVSHANDVAFPMRLPYEHSGFGGGNFYGYLIGLKLNECFTGDDGVPFLLEPARNRRFNYRLAKRWNLDRCH